MSVELTNSPPLIQFHKIMEQKNVSVYDIQLSIGLPISVISRIVEYGEGAIEDINAVMGCLNIKIADCIDESLILQHSNTEKVINIADLFKQKAIIEQLNPYPTHLVKSFKECSEIRYVVRVSPKTELEVEDSPEWNKLKSSKILQTHCFLTPQEALNEYKEHIAKLSRISHLFPTPDEVEAIEVSFGTIELLLEYYNIIFDPFENNRIVKIGKVHPIGTLNNYNSEYLQKVYGICAKPRTNNMKSKIYSQKDYEYGLIDEHLKLLNMFEIPLTHQGSQIFEFLVPKNFDIKAYVLETQSVFNEWDRLKFNVIENVK